MEAASLSTARSAASLSTASLSCRVGRAKYVPLRTVIATDTPAGTRSGSNWWKQAAALRAEADAGESNPSRRMRRLASPPSPTPAAGDLDCRAGQSARLRGSGGRFFSADSPKDSAGLGTPHLMPEAFGGFPVDVTSRIGKP